MASDSIPGASETGEAGLVFEIQRYSTEDGPGIRTTVFFKQCPLQCAWCQNPESIDRKPSIQWFKVKCIGCGTCVDVCHQHAISLHEDGIHINRGACKACGDCVNACPSTALKQFGRVMTVEQLVKEVCKDKAYYDTSGGGVTVSGGEPCMQAAFVSRFLEACKREGLHTALDTCGMAGRPVLERLLDHVDLVLYDLKEIDPVNHERFTGVPNGVILENCAWIASACASRKKDLWIRTPVIPGYTATDDNIRGIARFIVNVLLNRVGRWDLLSFNNLASDKYSRMDIGPWKLCNASLLAKAEMDHFVQVARDEGVRDVSWSGLSRA